MASDLLRKELRESPHDNTWVTIDDLWAKIDTLRRQVVVLEHDRRMLQDALVEIAPDRADAIMNDIRANRPKGSEGTT